MTALATQPVPPRRRDLPTDVINIDSPPSNATLDTEFGVYGTCSAINPAGESQPTIIVSLSIGGTTINREAFLNPEHKTWEAYFEGAPPGTGGTLTASCSPSTTTQSTNITIETDVPLKLEGPFDGEEFDDWGDAAVTGDRTGGYDVTTTLTVGGYVVGSSTLSPANGEDDLTAPTHAWSQQLDDIVASPTAGERYFINLTTVNRRTGATYYSSPGFVTFGLLQ